MLTDGIMLPNGFALTDRTILADGIALTDCMMLKEGLALTDSIELIDGLALTALIDGMMLTEGFALIDGNDAQRRLCTHRRDTLRRHGADRWMRTRRRNDTRRRHGTLSWCCWLIGCCCGLLLLLLLLLWYSIIVCLVGWLFVDLFMGAATGEIFQDSILKSKFTIVGDLHEKTKFKVETRD